MADLSASIERSTTLPIFWFRVMKRDIDVGSDQSAGVRPAEIPAAISSDKMKYCVKYYLLTVKLS